MVHALSLIHCNFTISPCFPIISYIFPYFTSMPYFSLQTFSPHILPGVIKCKKERGSKDICPQCSSPQHLNGTLFLGLTPDKLTCERPALRSPLKKWDNPVWAESEAEPDTPYTRDFEKPLGHLTIVLSDSHGNSAHVACDVRHPGDSSPMTWAANPRSPRDLSVNVSLVTAIECEIDREKLQNLWQLVAYYYESPAILERGHQRGNASGVTYQYTQAVNENSPYFTELKGYLVAEPSWLLQPRVTLRLNRKQTTTKKLVMDFTTLITKDINIHRAEDDSDFASSWALIRRGTAGRVQTALEGSKVNLECSVIASDPQVKMEWMLPDLSVVEDVTDKIHISENGQLVILNATLSDSGVYHCIVRTKAGVDLMPLRLTIKERSLSPTAFNGEKITVERGNTFSLPCEVTSAHPSHTIWYLPRNQVLLPTQQTRRAEVMENGTLVVRRLTLEDAGEYSCLASNLYGADMLTHIVEVRGEKASEKTKVQTEKEHPILTVALEEREGSGGDFQEIVRPFSTQLPEKVGSRQRNPNGFSKRIRMKDSKRKPNKSIKELDPNRWAEILAKANAKPGAALPTEQTLEEPSTVIIQPSTAKPTTAVATMVNTAAYNLHHTTTPQTDFPINAKLNPEVHSNTGQKEDVKKHSETLESQILQTASPRTTVPSGVRHPVEQSENKHLGEGGRNVDFVSAGSNRRRRPYRRRKPPVRRIHPHLNPLYHSSNKPQTTLPPTTTTTPMTTTPITTTTTTTTTTATTVPTTVESYETLSAEYQTEEDEYYDEYNYKTGDSLDAKEDLNSEILITAQQLAISITPFPSVKETNPHVGHLPGRNHLPNPKTIVTPKINNSALQPVEEKTKDVVHLKKPEINKVEMTKQTQGNGINNKNLLLKALEEQEKYQIETEGRKKDTEKLVTESYNTRDMLRSTTQPRFYTRPSPEKKTLMYAKSSSSNIFTSHSAKGGTRDEGTQREDKWIHKPTVKPQMSNFPIMEPLHPWLHQTNQGRGQTTTQRVTYGNQDRNTGRHTNVNPGRHFQPPRVPPTSSWSLHHHRHHHYPLYPSWPGQRSLPHQNQGK